MSQKTSDDHATQTGKVEPDGGGVSSRLSPTGPDGVLRWRRPIRRRGEFRAFGRVLEQPKPMTAPSRGKLMQALT
jgi:hypothetical protein